MTKAKLNHFRKLLTDYAARARGTAGGLEEQTRLPTGGDAVGNLSNAPMHLADAGTEMYSQEMNATLLEHEEHVMTEIAEALGRIDAGTYGVCENCGKKVPEGRLEVIPYTRFCVKCADQLGSELATNMNAGRPEPPRGSYAPRRERRPTGETSDTELLDGDRLPVADMEPEEDMADVHAAGTAGGGTAVGGLAGTNIGDGAPTGAGLEDAMGSGNFDAEEVDAEDNNAYAGLTGGAVGGTPAGKRASGGRVHGGMAPQPGPGDSPTGP
jgi:RNA polymerase-binding transcription factor DksA